ncbi:MAG: helix-turn-helix transcriptional regulator [Oscillibacter sp.]|nr:helix-turn-helix transcriptional regulator [Oscillibacter sp.]
MGACFVAIIAILQGKEVIGTDKDQKYSQIIINRILSLCKERGIAPYKLSTMSGVGSSTIHALLKGKTKNPQIITLHKLANTFNLTLAEFLDFPELNVYSFEDEETEEGDQEKARFQQAP